MFKFLTFSDPTYVDRPFFPCFSRNLNNTSEVLKSVKVYPNNVYSFEIPEEFQTSIIFYEKDGTVACFNKDTSTQSSDALPLCKLSTAATGFVWFEVNLGENRPKASSKIIFTVKSLSVNVSLPLTSPSRPPKRVTETENFAKQSSHTLSVTKIYSVMLYC